MRVLVAGATGVVGRQLVPMLKTFGHDVIGLARSRDRAAAVERLGAEPVVADALDRDAVSRAVRNLAPDAVVHMLTAIPAQIDPRHLARDFALTNRLRTEGTRNLLDAADRAGVRRVITQGLAYAYDPSDEGPANEDVPFWRNPPRQFAPVLDALCELERRTRESNGLVLRLGHLYGPKSIYAADGSFTRQVRAGKVPLVAGGTATFSFTHAYDAATAVVAALDKNTTGALNIVDDEPARMSEWLPAMAAMLDAPAPKSAPAVLARLAVGGWGVAFMTRLRGADNARARLSLDWRPRYVSWQQGFAEELRHHTPAA
ncbi:NAD(P)-dependent oxidoreductase [Micromonospora sp. NPDC050495]|uniref:NAD-dependent epimerase/dehydratase family protein n=1 Tax=Micromonospora sp. NPDC050495 TaxID=3154936 RepID=UPI0033FE92E5